MLNKAVLNYAHQAIAKLGKEGIVKCIITQNIDNLHQLAGSKNVIEFHGTTKTISYTKCHTKYQTNEVNLNNLPPLCKKCGGLLKPDFVFL